MKKQIVKMNVNGNTYTVINDTENKYNPLSVYKAWREFRDLWITRSCLTDTPT